MSAAMYALVILLEDARRKGATYRPIVDLMMTSGKEVSGVLIDLNKSTGIAMVMPVADLKEEAARSRMVDMSAIAVVSPRGAIPIERRILTPAPAKDPFDIP